MPTLLTNIAGAFAKPLILAALLPFIVVTSLFLLLVVPLFPFTLKLPEAVSKLESSWQVAWGTLVALVAAMLLSVLNVPIARFFSGYPWRHAWPGTLLQRWKKEEFARLRTERNQLATLWTSINTQEERSIVERLSNVGRPLALRVDEEFPYTEDAILPTTLGNVIRNTEEYAHRRYGISTIVLWPRLVAVLDARHATVLDDAKTSFDFALNCLFLCCCAALLTMTLALWQFEGLARLGDAASRAGVFVVLAALAYAAAVNRAQGWGRYVKAAVDLYRLDLLKKVGYQQTPTTIAQEKDIWSTVGSEWTFPDMDEFVLSQEYAAPPSVAAPPTTAVSGNGEPLVFMRAVSAPTGKPYATLSVTLLVQHTGDAAPTDLVVSDAVPPNWAFLLGSEAIVSTTGATVAVKGSSPVVLAVNALAVHGACTLSYRLQSLTATP